MEAFFKWIPHPSIGMAEIRSRDTNKPRAYDVWNYLYLQSFVLCVYPYAEESTHRSIGLNPYVKIPHGEKSG